jgi:hypothetical protein
MLYRLAVIAAVIALPSDVLAAALAPYIVPEEVPAMAKKRRNSDPLG